jgi:hypothetical protein
MQTCPLRQLLLRKPTGEAQALYPLAESGPEIHGPDRAETKLAGT